VGEVFMTATVDARKPQGSARKTYRVGSDPSVRVPMREITLTNGETHVLYDTSGPYTDPDVATDVRRGLEPLRASWIEAPRRYVELDRASSLYRLGREAMPELGDPLCFQRANRAAPNRARTSPRCTTRGAARSRPRWSSSRLREGVEPEFVRARSRAAAPSCRRTSTIPNSNR
jgi:phosphomethylpyrimidine synthase